MKINVEFVSLTFPSEAANGCSPSPTLFLGRSSVADTEPHSDQRHWWLWDIIASKALWHLLMMFLADPRPQPVSTQHIFPLRTGRVCIPGLGKGSFSNPYMQLLLDSQLCWSLVNELVLLHLSPSMCLFASFSPGTYPSGFVAILSHKSDPLHSLPNLHQIKFYLFPR